MFMDLFATVYLMLSALNLKHSSIAMFLISCFLTGNVAASTKPLKLCALYPHLKDSYWLSVNYGMVDEAARLSIALKVFEAGGYPNKQKQQAQLEKCHEWNADAIILGTVSPDLYLNKIHQLVGNTPVFASVNALTLDPKSHQLKGQVGVDWYWMGYYAGQYLKDKHPKSSGQANVALLLGPKASGGTDPVLQGFINAVQDSDIHIIKSYWADNDKELQRNLVQQIIERDDIDYIVGSAVAIEAAISELRIANKSGEIGLIATYLSHGVYRGLLRNRVEFAPTDKMVQQGRMSVQQAVNYLRGLPYQSEQTPVIEPLTPEKLNPNVISQSLSPSEYRPTFHVNN